MNTETKLKKISPNQILVKRVCIETNMTNYMAEQVLNPVCAETNIHLSG